MIKRKKNINITAVILTYNEELHIGRCIKALKGFVKEIIVIDSNSNDNTIKICKQNKIRIYNNKFINQAKQMNWALKNVPIKTKWIFRIDADEIVENSFFNKVGYLIEYKKNISGILIERKIKFLNKIINYGLTSPHKTLRIWKNGYCKYQNLNVDEQAEVKGKIYLSNAIIIDHNLKSFYWWLNKHNDYARRETKNYFLYKNKNKTKTITLNDMSKVKQNKKFSIYYKFPIFIRPVILFLYSYFFKLGFLSGVRGLIFYFFQILCYRMLVDIYIFKNN